ncbi:trans-sulfuration enzyme family protein [Wenzhouxiangella marina]|uniref:Cystathionine beta-lyase metC n=1 Tax=Wenzhouxiangella marina TaxID=1579979 RepID=A0A0K0XS16_9GAMM|nr:aminotransferase class I/II-fold pyridoxal phosphate-dependent enzyme [Wenzhouxiangella marina]AKS40416.1 Cystathionine beta-lyase metC [Wenzhouxiangella marina]MBB6088262.1 cystathionine beta-lyase [Wenzhouxiangella marina]
MSSKRPSGHLDTDCIHAGAEALPAPFGVNTPIVTSSAFDYRQDHVRYPRYHNTLNHEVVARRIAALEGGEAAMVTASGMGAISAIFFSLMQPGDHAILLDGLYGGTMDLVEGLLAPLGFRFSIWNGQPEDLPVLIEERTRLIHVESPTNPLMRVVDLAATARIAREQGVVSVVDNTFATPICQRPIELGFDLVMHSATKYFGGHSDLLCGALIGSSAMIDRLRPNVIRLGSSLNGQDLYLLERSLKTLAVRVERQTANAQALATWLHSRDGIDRVHYPGLDSDPGHAVARGQMHGFGAMLAFRLDDDRDPEAFLDALRIIQPAVSLAGVESTIGQPSYTSHAKLSAEERARLGIDERVMRLSVGIEALADLKHDLDQALG